MFLNLLFVFLAVSLRVSCAAVSPAGGTNPASVPGGKIGTTPETTPETTPGTTPGSTVGSPPGTPPGSQQGTTPGTPPAIGQQPPLPAVKLYSPTDMSHLCTDPKNYCIYVDQVEPGTVMASVVNATDNQGAFLFERQAYYEHLFYVCFGGCCIDLDFKHKPGCVVMNYVDRVSPDKGHLLARFADNIELIIGPKDYMQKTLLACPEEEGKPLPYAVIAARSGKKKGPKTDGKDDKDGKGSSSGDGKGGDGKGGDGKKGGTDAVPGSGTGSGSGSGAGTGGGAGGGAGSGYGAGSGTDAGGGKGTDPGVNGAPQTPTQKLQTPQTPQTPQGQSDTPPSGSGSGSGTGTGTGETQPIWNQQPSSSPPAGQDPPPSKMNHDYFDDVTKPIPADA
ncbi:uncharacterized protein UTRI_03967_B [Ustilago trichophora]|uniref:Uncharacterized protein n=1 Tax=Ustilago trichophora TaxID=86804 RepID=A0A5C3EAX2_9BASI|nr:uncharacterized protein UTRI_03967_B [Ustilago trichophora]